MRKKRVHDEKTYSEGPLSANQGFTLIETALTVSLIGLIVLVCTSLLIPVVKNEQRIQQEMDLQTQTTIFFQQLSQVVRSGYRTSDTSNHLQLYIYLPQADAYENMAYWYYVLEGEGIEDSKVIRRVKKAGKTYYEGANTMLEHVHSVYFDATASGLVKVNGKVKKGQAEHVFEWVLFPRVSGLE